MEIHKDECKGEGKGEGEDKFDPLHTMKAYGTIKLQLHLS